MALYVNHNTMAMHGAISMNVSYARLGESISKLSTGLRIQTAADDGSDFAVRELMRSDISTMHQGMRNANDGISLLQVADGALQVIDEKLLRMKELAEQAATGTYDSTQRKIIEYEYQQVASEITRISNATDFNGIKLLDGNISSDEYFGGVYEMTGKLKLHYGTGNNENKDFCFVQIGSTTASSLGLGTQSDPKSMGHTVSTEEGAANALVGISNAIMSKDKIRASLGALQNRLEMTFENIAVQAESLQMVESSISDIDVGEEMTLFVKNQILTQGIASILTQANATPKMALQLLGG